MKTSPGTRWSPRLPGRIPSLIFALNLLAGVMATQSADPKSEPDKISTPKGDLTVRPINHATLSLGWQGTTILVDPVGGANRFAGLPRPNLVLVTDIHGDHLDASTLAAVVGADTSLIAPAAVVEKLPKDLKEKATLLSNGQSKTLGEITIEALPMYNLTPNRQQFHAKGRGNGYVLNLGGTRVYISGDTEDVPEMRALKNIDVAFVCMNLPYTMTVDQAADAVRAFKPKIVYPYHYRGSDLTKFKQLVGENGGTDVRLRDWYK